MRKKLKICIILLIYLSILFIGTEVMAATTSISVDKTTIYVGDTVTATVKYTAAAWDLKVTADSGLTTSDTIQYANTTDSAENESKSFSAKFKASKAGELYIYLKGDVTDENSTVADSVSKKVKVTVKEKTTTTDKDTTSAGGNTITTDKNTTTPEKPKEKSDNANLSTLGVRITDSLAKELGVKADEYDFSGFSKNKTSYNVTVPKNVDSLKVIATAADSKASVKVTGNTGLEVGTNNKITIKVTAEAGNTKTYTIKVTKLAEEEKKPGNLIEDESDLYLTSLKIEGIDLSPEFANDTYSYTAKIEDNNINEVEVKAVANIKEAKVEISGNKDLEEGENTINVVLTVEGSTIKVIYQIVVTKEEVPITEETPNTDVNNNPQSSTTDIIGMFKGYLGVAIGVLVFMVIAVIILVILLRRENKKMKDDEEAEESETEEYNVYKNDENEFVSDEISKDNFIESLYKQRNGNIEEDLTENEKETLEEITKQTEDIFREKVEGQSVEHNPSELYSENPLEVRRKRRGKGKHSL